MSSGEKEEADPVTKEISILMIAYYFPPNAAVGGKRIARFCRYFPEYGINPHVLTLDAASCASLDLTFAQSINVPTTQARPRSTALDWYKRATQVRNGKAGSPATGVPSDASATKRSRMLDSVSKSVLALMTMPDVQRGWYQPAVKAGADLIRNQRFDVIMSSGPPWTAHEVGHKLSRRFGLPWIVDFRDAWVSDHWRDDYPDWRNRVDWHTEDRWLRDASLVLTTTERLRDSMLKNHRHTPSSRIVTITNGFDGAISPLQQVQPVSNSDQIVFVHTGELYRGRRIDTLCAAVQKLTQGGAFGERRPKLIFIGETDPEIEASARTTTPELFENGSVEFRPPVSWEEAQAALKGSDVLLLVQGDHPTAIPAKFFEYLQTGKPILAIGAGGALKDMIQDTQSGFVADPEDPIAIAAAIENSLKMHSRTGEEISRFAGKYHFKNLTLVLTDHIRTIVS
jgi:glycosyltransferase involved in cell wall biosynthesis